MSTMASQTPASPLLAQSFVQAHIKAPRPWPLWGESTGDRWIPLKKASNAENVFICLRHHAISPKTVEFYYPPRRRRCLSADENVILTKFFSLAALKIIILQPVMKISSIWRHLSFSVTKTFRRLKACRTIITSTTLFNHTTDEAT